MPAVSVAAGEFYAQAAAVCLEVGKHKPGASLTVKQPAERKYCLTWQPADDQMRRTHNDHQDATKHGAYAVAFVLARELTEFQVVLQSRKGTGFDFWLGKDDPDLFHARLEVSGILQGDDQIIKQRVKEKKQQPAPSNKTKLPAYACVVEFSRPEAHFVKA